MDEDSDWGSWGPDPAATIFQQQQQQQQQSSTRSEILHAATSGKGTSTGAAAAHPTSSNGNVKSAPKKSTSRQSSITRLSTIMSQQSPPADIPADAHIQKLPLRQTSVSSQGSPSAADEWQSLLADTTAAPIKVQASKARPTLGPPKLQGRTDAAGTTAAGDTSGIATAGLKTSSSRVAGKAADLPSDSQRAISSRLVSAGLPGRGQLPARGGLSERGQQPRAGRTAAAQTPKEGSSSSPSKAEISPLDASHSAVPGQGPPASVKTADQQPPSVFSDSSLVADSLATADQAEAAFSAAGQPLSYGGLEESKITPLDVEKEVDKAEQQSGFVPIPFGGSSSRPSFAATAVAAPFGSHMDLDSMDDSFFDSIGTGESVAVAPLAELQSQSGLISPYPTEPTPAPSYTQQLQAATELSVSASAAASPAAQQAAVALDLPEDFDDRQQGDYPQRQAFSIPFSEAAVESHATAEFEPNMGAPTLHGVSSGASQQHDRWAGQHVPSQGFSPHLSPLLPSHGANPLNPPGYSPGQIPAAPVASAAASSFPTTMSSPFAQAGYPPQSDPWAFEPEPSSSLPPAQPGYPPSSSAQPANIWAPVATHPGANPWDPSAAGSSPWDSGVAGQAPAGLGGEYGGQDSEYRSPDGRPAVPLMVFGFAGKMYCWRPATSSSGIAGGGNGFGGSSVGTLQFLSWPKLVTETTPAQQQQQQQQPPHRPQAFQESSMSATHALLTHFPGPLMPNTHKDKGTW
ncbi:hypothetical protein WJX82_011650 [Trebouxia sp. C0006]